MKYKIIKLFSEPVRAKDLDISPTLWPFANKIVTLDYVLSLPVTELLDDPDEIPELMSDNVHIWNMLVTLFPNSGYSEHSNNPVVLNVGCGNAWAMLALSSYFGKESELKLSEKIRLIGIDAWDFFIKGCEITWTEFPYEFLVGDARGLAQYSTIPEQVDIVFMRHPKMFEQETNCIELLIEASRILRPGGVLITTGYTGLEHQRIVDVVQKQGLSISVNQENPFAEPTMLPGSSKDQFVMMAKK